LNKTEKKKKAKEKREKTKDRTNSTLRIQFKQLREEKTKRKKPFCSAY